MTYDLHKPCNNCPFLREGGIRLHRERASEIACMMIGGARGEFPCHKTTREDDDRGRVETKTSKHCAGALIFSEKHERPTQMMRICERIGMYDRTKLRGFDDVFDSIDEMEEANL